MITALNKRKAWRAAGFSPRGRGNAMTPMPKLFRESFLGTRAFTLLELLVCVGLILLLLGALLPGLSRARGQAKSAVCQSNIRQLALANTLHAQESLGRYTPGAAEFLKNLHRWHGSRESVTKPFNPADGPLIPYLGPDAQIRACPEFEPRQPGFERGNGGYGYNNAYVGVQTATNRHGRTVVISDRSGALADEVRRPGETLMFADSAFVSRDLIEYSFAEPRFHPRYATRADPSIHFRHAGLANVAWCDGHATRERRTFTWSSGFYEGSPDRFDIGWFGPTDDNSLFDLR